MLMMNLGGPATLEPAIPSTNRFTNRWPRPATSAVPSFTATACGYGYQMTNGVCMSQGCIDGRSPCVVQDHYGRTCSYDQLLAFQHQSGEPSCGPAPQLPPPPNPPSVPAPPNVQTGIPVDVSSNPGTQITATIPEDQAAAIYGQPGIPRWALVLGGLTVLGIVIALFARR